MFSFVARACVRVFCFGLSCACVCSVQCVPDKSDHILCPLCRSSPGSKQTSSDHLVPDKPCAFLTPPLRAPCILASPLASSRSNDNGNGNGNQPRLLRKSLFSC